MILGLIPARLKSQRLPNKPLINIDGLPLIIHVLKRIKLSKLIDRIIVCTDDKLVKDCVETYGGRCVLTSKNFKNGTERISSLKNDIRKSKLVIDIQCDELFLNPIYLDHLIKFHIKNNKFDIVIPHSLITKKKADSQNIVKIISNQNNKIHYMTRSLAPSLFRYRKKFLFKKHLDFISFKPKSLLKFARLGVSKNEMYEGVELNRAIDNNLNVGTIFFDSKYNSINTKKDLKSAKKDILNCKIRKKY